MKLLVIIPFQNRIESLLRLVDSLQYSYYFLEENWKCQVKIVLVNDHSNEEVVSRLTSAISQLSFIQIVNSHGIGPGAARNTAYDIGNFNYVAYTDSDCIVASNWLQIILSIIQSKNPLVLQGCPFAYQKKNEYGLYEEKLYEIMFSSYINENESTMVDSRNLILNNKIFNLFGREIFSEKLGFAAAESRVLAQKLSSKDIHIQYSNDVKIYHEDPCSLMSSCRTKYRHGAGRVELWRDNPQCNIQLINRYFTKPIALGIPDKYVVPVHLSFLYGYFSNIGLISNFWKLYEEISYESKVLFLDMIRFLE